MPSTIIHLTDIHIKETSAIHEKTHPLCQAILRNCRSSSHLFIVISGDIANTGKLEEYKLANTFLSNIRLLISQELPALIVRYILVAGNHDCNFEYDTQLRRNSLRNMDYMTFGDDNSVKELCLSVQNDFWKFYSNFNNPPSDQLFYTINETVQNTSICFTLLNTAWMSSKDEKAGSLFFPCKKYLSHLKKGKINICVWHHPVNWFNPSTEENNKKEFEEFISRLGNIHLFGHEHYQNGVNITDINTQNTSTHFSGTIFNDNGNSDNSGFSILLIEEKTNEVLFRKYDYQNNEYVQIQERNINLSSMSIKRKLAVKESFLNEINDLKIPLSFSAKKNVTLTDLYIYPDLDSAKLDTNKFDNYLDSKKLISLEKNCLIDGESQIGKSSLLYTLFNQYYENNYSPLLIRGNDIKDLSVEKQLKKAFKEQYTNESSFETFMQLPKKEKILLIDDFGECHFNSSAINEYYKKLVNEFDKIIITINSAESILPSIHAELRELDFFTIKPLGYKKRNDLIEKYVRLKENNLTFNEETFIETITSTFDNVQEILGNKYIPSYPLYILSILHALDYKSLNLNETSFGYCYQSLITYALIKAGIPNSSIDTYFNFLTELAYYFIKNDVSTINESECLSFYQSYSQKFICPSYQPLISNLKKSKIILFEGDKMRFGYNYILYYLSAKKISEISTSLEGKELISTFFNNLDNEKNANILVFITHHSKDITFIDESRLNSMLILDNISPITLDKNDPFYKILESLVSEIKKDVLEVNRNPIEERNSLLEQRDREINEIEHLQKNNTFENEELYKKTLPFKQAFRSIEILGQIIKNRKGSLEINKINDMISELYTTAFRTIAYLSSLLNETKEEIVKFIAAETNTDAHYHNEIEEKINNFMQIACLDACFATFSKIIQSVGSKDLKKQYEEVGRQLNTPAAKLVSFGVNSYYSSITAEELKKLADELKGNQVALIILRARVKSYVYMKKLDYKTKQKFASILSMEISNQKTPSKKDSSTSLFKSR